MKSILFYLVILIAFPQFAQAQPIPQDTSDIVWQVNFQRHIYKIFFSNDSKQILICTESYENNRLVEIRDVIDGRLIQELPGETEASLSHDGTLLVTHSSDSILIREYPSLNLVKKIISDGLDGKFAFSPDNKYFASAADIWGIRIFYIDSGKVVDSIKNFPFIFNPKYGGSHRVYIISYNLDGTKLLFSGDWAFLYDLKTDTVIHQFLRYGTPTYSPDFNKIGIMRRDSDVVYMYNSETYQEEKKINLGGNYISYFIFSPVENFIIIASENHDIGLSVWSLDSNRFIYRYYIDSLKRSFGQIACSNDSNFIVSQTAGILFLFRAKYIIVAVEDTNKVDTNKISNNIIYPNPTTGLVKIVYNLINSENINIKISDNTGRNLNSVNLGYLEKGNNIYEFNASALSMGIYYITIQGSSFLQTFNLVKE